MTSMNDYRAVSATLDPTETYRYSLTREWSPLPRALFVMLNPSTADASKDDPTIRKCVGFAQRYGCGSLEVVNLYAYRATEPEDLWRFAGDRIGPKNHDAIVEAAGRARLIVAAWGANAREESRNSAVADLLDALGETWCLGFTKGGLPRHPLMVAYLTPLVPFCRRATS